MQQPGRKAAADLQVVRLTAADRPQPPEFLTEWQQGLWRQVTATKPADWFTDDTLPLLEAYCEAALTHRNVSAAMRNYTPEQLADEDIGKAYGNLGQQQARAAGVLAQLSIKMRLSQSSRYGARGASGAHDRTLKTAKPWET